MIENFMEDTKELDAFITGAAGTGKTTKLKEVCEWLLNTEYTFQVVAYTHKAKQVLKSKLPEDTPISTLHSFLKKRPGINENAPFAESAPCSQVGRTQGRFGHRTHAFSPFFGKLFQTWGKFSTRI